jgi:cell division control protein 7
MPHMTVIQIRQYLRALFESLRHLHSYKIIHRDVKPGNFLYNPLTETFALVDFGLAQIQVDFSGDVSSKITTTEISIPSPNLKRKRSEDFLEQKIALNMTKSNSTTPLSSRANLSHPQGISKKSLRAPRGGTRGFRAPEVLLKCHGQTTALDIWSAGVIFLCTLSTRYPFFPSPDDLSSLSEIGQLFGTREMKEVAALLNRKITFPCDPQEIPKACLADVCNKLSSRSYSMPDSAFHLLERCLDLNPMTRITASEALRHPFLIE